MTSRTQTSRHNGECEKFGVLEGKSTEKCSEKGRKLKKMKRRE
jgi:hypothetical protein